MDNLMLKFDEAVTGLFAKWDSTSTALMVISITALIYLVISSRDPDTHPLLLQRQAQVSAVRQEGESAVLRAHSAPHGMPLVSGLNIKDPGDSKWSRGRDGDLGDIWRRTVAGDLDRDGKETGQVGKLFTVLGSHNVKEHNLADITRQINLIGHQIKQNGGENVAIYLPNSIEFLATFFACAFYNLTAVLVPYDSPTDKIVEMFKAAKVDTVIAPAGSFPFDVLTQNYSGLKQLIWVVDEGSSHMDWNEVPKGTGGAVNVSTWQEIIQDAESSAGTDLPAADRTTEPKKILTFSPTGELVQFTQANIIAGIAGQLTSIPNTQKITHSDLFLPIDSWSSNYPLTLTLAALFSNASLALTSVASKSPDLVLATHGVAPTIIVTSATTLTKLHANTASKLNSTLYNLVHWMQTRALVQDGAMPVASFLSRLFDHLRPAIGTTPGKLRLIYVSKAADDRAAPPLTSQMLSDLRIYTGARIIFALTGARIAGAVAQTGLYDYRVDGDGAKESHFGAPVTSVEVLCRDTGDLKTTDAVGRGEIYARGPAVVGGEAAVGVMGKFREDMTLSLL